MVPLGEVTPAVPHLTVDAGAIARLWNRAADAHPIHHDLIAEITSVDPSFHNGDVLAEFENEQLVGFAIAKRLRRMALGCERFGDIGYVPLLAVDPAYQRRGIGRRLLARAEAYLRVDGAARVVAGGSFHHAVAAVPQALGGAPEFFASCGYEIGDRTVWDLARDVRRFDVPARVGDDLAAARVEGRLVGTRWGSSLEPEDTAALLEFLAGEFPGRWYRDVGFAMSRTDTTALVVTLFSGLRAVGFAQVHLPGTPGTLRWQGFDPEIAAIGPVGVSRDLQGRGLGLAVVALAADHLRRVGARRVVIDWTDLLDFYGRLGFEPWLSYVPASKTL